MGGVAALCQGWPSCFGERPYLAPTPSRAATGPPRRSLAARASPGGARVQNTFFLKPWWLLILILSCDSVFTFKNCDA